MSVLPPDISEIHGKFIGVFFSSVPFVSFLILIKWNYFSSQGEWGPSLPTLNEISAWLDKATETDDTIFYEQGKWWYISKSLEYLSLHNHKTR